MFKRNGESVCVPYGAGREGPDVVVAPGIKSRETWEHSLERAAGPPCKRLFLPSRMASSDSVDLESVLSHSVLFLFLFQFFNFKIYLFDCSQS